MKKQTTIAYLRVSTDGQDLKNQKLEILDYPQKHFYTVDDWIEVKVSSRKSTKERLVQRGIGITISFYKSFSIPQQEEPIRTSPFIIQTYKKNQYPVVPWPMQIDKKTHKQIQRDQGNNIPL